jgi:transcriptional regulator with XRE-family HTH domain
VPTPKPCEKCHRDYYPLRRGYCRSCDNDRRRRYGYECSYVDAEPVRQHVRALQAAGIGQRRLAQLAGLQRNTVRIITNGRSERGGAPTKRVHQSTAEAILAVRIPDIPHDPAIAGKQLVDSLGSVRRIQSLVAYGYSRREIARRIGITPNTLSRIVREPKMLASTARKIAELYTELEATPGTYSRSINEGRKNGWKPPMAWDDDIDKPEAAPDTDDAPVSFLERYEEMRDLGFNHREIFSRIDVAFRDLSEAVDLLTAEELSAAQIAELLNVSQRTVVRRRGKSIKVASRWLREQSA